MNEGNIKPTPTARFRISVTLLDDLHAGSGLGGAGIDALLARDARGQPVIRWSHLKGLLKDALHERAQALGHDESQTAEQSDVLFGKRDEPGDGQSRGIVRGLSLRVSEASGPENPALVWSSTARKPGSRVPLDDTLRRIEFVRAGTQFFGEIRVRSDLLGADAQLVEKLLGRLSHLGGGRSRGAGRVKIDVIERCEITPPTANFPSNTALSGQEVRLVVRALEPLCLAATGYPGNLIPTHSFLSPGTVMGMLTRWAMDHGLSGLAEALLDHHIVCGPGYPLPLADDSIDAARADAVPIPLSCHSPKPEGQSNAARPWWTGDAGPIRIDNTLLRTEDDEGEKLKRPGAHVYVYTTDARTWRRFECPRAVAMRNDAGYSQHNRSEQQLFAVEQITEDTGFVIRLRVREPAKPLLLHALKYLKTTGDWLHAGRGAAPLRVVACAVPQPAGAEGSSVSESKSLILYVESDLILKAPDGRFHTRLDAAAVHAMLREAGVPPDSMKLEKNESEPWSVRGWDVRQKTCRTAPVIAIRRGSVAKLNFASAETRLVCAQALAQRGFTGFGERADEGYGRVRVDFCPDSEQVTTQEENIPMHPEEALRAEVEAILPKAPKDFTPSRWQALRNAAGDPQMLREWVALAKKRLKPETHPWLDALLSRNADFLRELGLRQAKAARRERNKS